MAKLKTLDRKYSIYKITSPSGRSYVGLTITKVRERWLCHAKRAKYELSKRHPFYDAIRKYGRESFTVETLHEGLTLEEANLKEVEEISRLTRPYNVSPGGNSNGDTGGKAFWKRLNDFPEEKEVYLKKLSDSMKVRVIDWDMVHEKARQWRKDNPKEAYYLARRGSRIAAKMDKRIPAEKDGRPLIERLRWKHNRSAAISVAKTKSWSQKDAAYRESFAKKISVTHLAKNALKSPEERRGNIDKARAAIDTSIQGPAASKGLKTFWADLKKDPQRYADFMSARVKTWKQNRTKK